MAARRLATFCPLAALLAAAAAAPPQTLGTWLPTYGDSETNALANATAAAAALARLAAAGANTVYIDAWHGGLTTFPSSAWERAAGAPWPAGSVDYLSFPVVIAKQMGLRVIAWFEYGLIYGGQLQAAQPDWCIGVDGGGFAFMNASLPAVGDLLEGIALDALRHQPLLDGVQFDDHFAWPSSLPGPGAGERRAAMTALAARLHGAVRGLAPSALFSLAPNPADSALADQNVDWPAWLGAGLVDDAVVQLYCYDAAYFAFRVQQQIAALPPGSTRALAPRLKFGILLNNGNVSNANATAMMREELAAAANSSAPVGGQVLWYARGILYYAFDEVREIWTHVEAAAVRVGRPFLPAALAEAAASSIASPWCTFAHDSASLILTTPLWRLRLAAADGSLELLADGAGAELLRGSGELWHFQGAGASLSNGGLTPFAWTWAPDGAGGAGAATLALSWGSPAVVVVNVTVPSGARWFDLDFALLTSPPHAGAAGFDSLWLPSLPAFDASRIAAAFFPQLPGIMLNASFFSRSSGPGAGGATLPYPGSGVFAETIHFNFSATGTGGGAPFSTLSVMTVSGPDYAIPAFKSLRPAAAPAPAGYFVYDRSLNPINVTEGCDPLNGGWSGGGARPSGAAGPPCALGLKGTVKTRFAFGGSVLEDIELYGESNGLLAPPPPASLAAAPGLVPYPGAGPLPPIAAKLPTPILAQLARSPLFKLDKGQNADLNFSQYKAAIIDKLPVPGIVHFVGFEPGRFDSNYPDFLPPDPSFGTGCDLAAAFDAAVASGHATMPYTNPTWWDPRSPTLSSGLPPDTTLSDVCAHNTTGGNIAETYPDVPPEFGYVVEQQHPYVAARWRRLLCQLSPLAADDCVSASTAAAAAAAAATAPCDESSVRLNSTLVFEDQVSARNARADSHPLQGGLAALGYMDSLVQHAAASAGVRLCSEQGQDKLARSAVGFFGNNVEQAGTTGWPWFSDGVWTPFPASQLLFGASVLYHVHNLAGGIFALNTPYLCWALGTGTRLSMDAARAAGHNGGGGVPEGWYRGVGLLQRVVVSQYTGFALDRYDSLLEAAGESLTTGSGASLAHMSAAPGAPPLFPSASAAYGIVTNWRNAQPLDVELELPWPASGGAPARHTLPPRGCAAYGEDADAVGGLFTAYNGSPLAQGPEAAHFIIEDRRGCGIGAACVYHPMGADTALRVQAPAAACGAPRVSAQPMGASVSATFDAASGLVTFQATQEIGGESVDHFEITCGA